MSYLAFFLNRLVRLDVKHWFEELLRQLSYAIKNQLVASKAPYYELGALERQIPP